MSEVDKGLVCGVVTLSALYTFDNKNTYIQYCVNVGSGSAAVTMNKHSE